MPQGHLVLFNRLSVAGRAGGLGCVTNQIGNGTRETLQTHLVVCSKPIKLFKFHSAAWSVSELANKFSQAPYLASSWFGEPASEVYPIDQLNEGDVPNITIHCFAVGTFDKEQN